MIQVVAILSLVIISFGLSLGNYWFMFGLWPKSWLYFFAFMVANMVTTTLLISKVIKGGE